MVMTRYQETKQASETKLQGKNGKARQRATWNMEITRILAEKEFTESQAKKMAGKMEKYNYLYT